MNRVPASITEFLAACHRRRVRAAQFLRDTRNPRLTGEARRNYNAALIRYARQIAEV